jgi:hypothetical protein
MVSTGRGLLNGLVRYREVRVKFCAVRNTQAQLHEQEINAREQLYQHLTLRLLVK